MVGVRMVIGLIVCCMVLVIKIKYKIWDSLFWSRSIIFLIMWFMLLVWGRLVRVVVIVMNLVWCLVFFIRWDIIMIMCVCVRIRDKV